MSFKFLKTAVRNNNVLEVKTFLNDLNCPLVNDDGISIIWYVNRYAMKQSMDTIKLLFKYINVEHCRNAYNQNLLHVSIEEFNYDLFDLCLSRTSINIDELDDCGMSPLHYAVYVCSAYIVERLLDKNACIMVEDFEGYTPLHYLAMGTRTQFGDYSRGEMYNIYCMLINSKRLKFKGCSKYSVIELAIRNRNVYFLDFCKEFYEEILTKELDKLKNKINC